LSKNNPGPTKGSINLVEQGKVKTHWQIALFSGKLSQPVTTKVNVQS